MLHVSKHQELTEVSPLRLNPRTRRGTAAPDRSTPFSRLCSLSLPPALPMFSARSTKTLRSSAVNAPSSEDRASDSQSSVSENCPSLSSYTSTLRFAGPRTTRCDLAPLSSPISERQVEVLGRRATNNGRPVCDRRRPVPPSCAKSQQAVQRQPARGSP